MMLDAEPLPPGWCWVKISEITQINFRDPTIRNLPDDLLVTFVPMAAVDGEKGIIARPEKRILQEVRKGFTSFSEGDVIFAKITPCMENGKAAIVSQLQNGRGFGSTEFHVLRPGENIIAQWLFHFVRQENFRADAKASFTGTAGQLRVPVTFLSNYPIPLPPLAEQERIVAKIEALFSQLEAGVAALRRAQAALKRYRASLLKSACEGRLVAQDPSDEPAEAVLQRLGKSPLRGEGLPVLPPGWCWVRLGETIRPTQKRVNPQEHPGLPYIGMENVEAHTMRLLNTIPATQMKSAADSFCAGDVLYGRLRPYLNKVLCPDFDGLCSTEFIIFRKVAHLYSKYLQYFLNSWEFVNFANSLNAGDRPRVKFEQLANHPIPLPPLAEQERIVAELERRLTIVAQVETAIQTGLARSARLRQAILKRAFRGEL